MRGWMITYRGRQWRSDEATVGQFQAVAALGFDAWDAVTPWESPSALGAWLAALLASDLDLDLETAVAQVAGSPLDELLGTLEDLPAPEDEGGA